MILRVVFQKHGFFNSLLNYWHWDQGPQKALERAGQHLIF